MATPRRCAATPVTFRPATTTRPASGSSSPATTRSTVDLPDPRRPDEHEQLPGGGVQVHGVERDDLPVPLGDTLEGDGHAPPWPKSGLVASTSSLSPSSTRDHAAVCGTARIVGMASTNTRDEAGGVPGRRNAGDRATSGRDGTVRPDSARMRWPAAVLAYSTNRHAASARGEPLAMQ